MGYEMYFLRLVRNFLIISLCASYGKADVISDLYDALHMDRINEIIRLEGIQDAEGTGEAYLPPNSVDRFVAQAKSVYQLEAMERDFKRLLTQNLSIPDANKILLFYQKPLGKVASELEVSARIAISDAYIEEMAKLKLEEAVKSKNKRLDEIESVIRTLSLIHI